MWSRPPSGNLRDITLRALDVLRTADVVAAEDTRVTAVLLRHYGIATRPLSLHEHNETRRARAHRKPAPRGQERRARQRRRHAGDQRPGGAPGARHCAMRGCRSFRSPAPAQRSRPFPPPVSRASDLRSWASCLSPRKRGVRSSHRWRGFRWRSSSTKRRIGCRARSPTSPTRWAAIAASSSRARSRRRFETIARLSLAEAPGWLDADSNRTRGEFVLAIDAPPDSSAVAGDTPDSLAVDSLLQALAEELPPARAARVAASATGLPRDVLYERLMALKPRLA